MTLPELEAFKAEAAARGLTHVMSLAGLIPLAAWSPYNCFGKPGDGALAELLPVPTWMNHYQAVDFDRNALPEEVEGAMWTFVNQKDADRINEAEANQKRKRR